MFVSKASRGGLFLVLCLEILLGCCLVCVNSKTLRSATYLQCPSECSCLGNVVDCSKRSLSTVPRRLPDWVEILDICSNSIKSIDAEAFEGLDRLSEINLSNNPLADVNCSAFSQLPKLASLKMGHCRLSKFPSCDVALNISHLLLDHNNITVFDDAFLSSVVELQSLDLSYNRIARLNESAFLFMPKLQHLFLNSNLVTVINRSVFDNLTSLEWLKLSKNRIQSLQKNTFSRLVRLKHLELERNRIRVIDGLVFYGLDNLLSLKLKRNSIAELMDGAFWGLRQIQILDLSHNNISSVSNKWLYGLESLLQLSLAHNQINQIMEDSWRFCQHLIQLDLSHNLLTSLSDKAFDKLETLEQLSISHNRLGTIADDSFTTLSALNVLDLSFNEISWRVEDKGSPFSQLKTLARLSLEHNQIKSISKQTFQGLGRLNQLLLDGNNISYIQANAFESLTELREFQLNSSHFICDCQLSWLKRWVNDAGFQSSISAQCEHPESLKDMNVLDLAATDFKCVNFPKPIITHEPESQTAIKYGKVTLTCQAASGANSPLTIEWKKDNLPVTDTDIVTMVTDETADDMVQVLSVLRIWPVLDNHAGSYQCSASNSLGTSYSTKAVITVSVFPTFLKTPSNVVVKSGTTARLDCAATGSPLPQISLQKDGGDDFPAARERRMHIFPSDEMFFIVDVKTEDQGLYTCIATNDVGTITANASLQVLEAPAFVKHMENKMTIDGDTTVLECMTSGSPKPRLEWLKDGVPLQPTLRHFFTADDQLLVIVQTQSSDAGDYTCVMTNTLGSERQTSRLTVAAGDGFPHSSPSVEDSTTTGIIIIAVVCCVVGTSLVWVIVIYKTRQRQKSFHEGNNLAGKRLTHNFRGACHSNSPSLHNINVQGHYCPIQAAAYSGSEVNDGMKCQQYRCDPTSLFQSDTEDEDVDGEEHTFSYRRPHQHDSCLAGEQSCRQRSDSGTHTASSSLSTCTNNSNATSEPLQTFQSFLSASRLPSTPSDNGQPLAVARLQSGQPLLCEKNESADGTLASSTPGSTPQSDRTAELKDGSPRISKLCVSSLNKISPVGMSERLDEVSKEQVTTSANGGPATPCIKYLSVDAES